jgi:nucleotide-binding universal stress UspA family protein
VLSRTHAKQRVFPVDSRSATLKRGDVVRFLDSCCPLCAMMHSRGRRCRTRHLVMPWNAEPTEHVVPTSEAAEWTHALTRQLRAEGTKVTEVVCLGHAADALITEAKNEGVDLIVVGQHGRSELPARSPGSLVQELARSTPCPILIVPWKPTTGS